MDQSTAGYLFQTMMLAILVIAGIGFATGGTLPRFRRREDRDTED